MHLGDDWMLFKFLTGNSISNLQSGLILSQFGGLLMIFMAFMAGDKMDEGGARYVFVSVGVVRMVIPILIREESNRENQNEDDDNYTPQH